MSKAISQNEFEQRIKEHYPNEQFEIINYTTMSNFLQIKCCSCKKILSYPHARNFLAKNKTAGCSACAGLRAKAKNNIAQLEKKYNILNVERKHSGQLWYTCECKNCGRISTHEIISFLNNTCRCEGKGNHWSEEELRLYFEKTYANEYTLISPFQGVNKKHLVKHSCGFVWSVTLAHLLYNKTGCPRCCKKQSKGCKIIEKTLIDLNLKYDKEYYLTNSLQRFDFYLEIDDKKYAIEYNGEQHYKYNPFMHGHDITVFEKYKDRDAKKALYCIQNNIQLIVIPYTFSNDEIKNYINKLFNSSTTSSMNVATSVAKQCSPNG